MSGGFLAGSNRFSIPESALATNSSIPDRTAGFCE